MRDARLRRHDLVWLDPAVDVERLGVPAEHRAEVADWLRRRRPLVVARHDAHPHSARLGFTLPGTGPRQRREVRAPRAAIVAHEPPPLVESVLDAAPGAWRAPLSALASALREVGLAPRIYGSLVTQAYTGAICVRPGSDADVLIDCASRAEALAALAVLDRHGDGPPRVDGELRMPNGWAVAWRELASALAGGGRVLAKADTGVQLMDVEDFLGASRPLGVVDGHPRAPLAGRPV